MNSSYSLFFFPPRQNDSPAVALTEAPKANEPDGGVTGRRARWMENKKAVCHLVFIWLQLETKGSSREVKRMGLDVLQTCKWTSMLLKSLKNYCSFCQLACLSLQMAAVLNLVPFKLSCVIDFIVGPSSLCRVCYSAIWWWHHFLIYLTQISILGRGIMQIRVLDIMHIHRNMHQRFYCSLSTTLCINPKWKNT